MPCEAVGAEKAEDRPAGANVAIGAKYTLWPQPNYAHCTDPDDAVQLTDGKSTKDYFWTQKGTVGWSGKPYAAVTVDLGRIEPISGVALTTAAGAAGVVWPASIEVHVSDDGTHFREAGDLLALDLKRHGPWPKGYAIRRLASNELATRGRFVRFMIVPLAGGGYIFTDEVEVLRGPAELLQPEPSGKPVGDVAEVFQRGRISRALRHRFTADSQALEKAIRKTQSFVVPPSGGAVEEPPRGGTTNGVKAIDEAARNRLLGKLPEIDRALKPEDLPHDASFRAVLPMGDAHARLFQLQAELWRAGGSAPLAAAAATPWDPLDPFQRPAPTGGSIEVHPWRVGGTGSYFWAFGDDSGSSSWNEYLATAGPFTPLFLDRQTVTPGKHMEAIRESVQDYECLVMLREAVRRAKGAGCTDANVSQAERLLDAGVAEVLAAPGAEQIHWHVPKDRTSADALRVKLLEALTALP